MNRIGLDGEVAIVTGGARDIGRAIADCAFSTGAVFDISGGRATY